MSKKLHGVLLGGSLLLFAAVAFASDRSAIDTIHLNQQVDDATLQRYHHIDQGTRLLPAAWMAALKTADGSTGVMSPQVTAKFGFLHGKSTSAMNPYAWPLGFTVSDPRESDGISVAGVTCAACHTGQIEHGGKAVRIEGGQSMVDLAGFEAEVLRGLAAVAADPVRKAAFIKDAIAAGYPAERMSPDLARFLGGATAMLHGEAALTANLPGPGRVDAVQGIVDALLRHDLNEPHNIRTYDAPVSYPYLWDIWRLSWLQYNSFLPPQSQSRNIGEVLGTSGRTNFLNASGGVNPAPQRWRTSVQIDNLIWIESVLKRLSAPAWPAQVLGPIDAKRAAEGRRQFETHCSGCHGIKQLPDGKWDVTTVELNHIGTDPLQTVNWAGRTYDATKLGLSPAVTATSAAVIINAVRNQYYADHNTPKNDREADATFVAPCGYKARPLIGAWATPPFLHNGSVRTVYELLSDKRSSSFGSGARQYDAARLGYVDDTRPGAFRLDTTAKGNSNAGHWWTDEANRPGRIGPRLSEAQKLGLIEYLKAATYANYPRVRVASEQALPCSANPDWALSLAK